LLLTGGVNVRGLKLKSMVLVAILLVVAYGILNWMGVEWLDSLELVFLNARTRLRGEIDHQDRVVIVAIDDRSLTHFYQHHNDPWPWSRSIYADLVERLNQLGAQTIFLDISLDTYQEEEGDQAFAETLFFNQNVVLGSLLVGSQEEFAQMDADYQNRLQSRDKHLDYRYRLQNVISSQRDLPDYFSAYMLVAPETSFMNPAFAYGSFEIGSASADGRYHDIPLIMEEEAREGLVLMPNVTILGLASYFNLDPGDYFYDMEVGKIVLGDKREVPVNNRGFFQLNYYGSEAFREISVIDLFEEEKEVAGGANKSEEKLTDIFADSMVLIGYTAQAKGLYDVRPTPFNRLESGVQIHATALENILGENYLHEAPFWQNMLLVFFAVFFLQLLWQLKNFWLSILFSVVFIGAINGLNYLLYLENIWLELFFPNLALASVLLGNSFLRVYREYTERIQTRNFFSRYVPEAVVEEILADPERINPGGEEREVTVLFSDIVGFTSIAEQLQPTELVDLLNEYLGEMATIVKQDYKGTLDKFVGDAVIAIFGAPLSGENDAERAVGAALAMQKRAQELQQQWQERGEEFSFDLGIGINTGKAVVGNIGSEERVNYTCIGDTVNLAARLEGATREQEGKILISEATYKKVKDNFLCQKVKKFRVKGKKEPVEAYQVMGKK